MYPVVFFDARRVKIRDEATVRSKAVYLALAVLPDGSRDILGIGIEQTEGAKFWLQVFTDLKTRLPGHPDCRHRWVERDERGARRRVSHHHAADVHRAPDAAQPRLCELEGAEAAGRGPAADLHRGECGGRRHGSRCVRARRVGHEVSDGRRRLASRLDARDPFFAFPPAVRRIIDTTTALESVHAPLRKIIKTRGHFPSDEAATKLIWLALRNITARWARGPTHWTPAMNQFAILYEGRFTKPSV